MNENLPSGTNIALTEADKNSLKLKTQEFSPTIIIGIGGTGKEVLLRVRRQFVERYGSLIEFPIASYLYIDTDNAPAEETGIARERDFLIRDIDFQPAEKVFNPVNPSEYIARLNDVPHIKRWLNSSGEIGKLGTMNTGAGQIRPAARLAFFHNFEEICNKLLTTKSRITDARSINFVKEKHHIKSVNTEKINVYVIASISGGTGSGMFIDLGFLIRDLFKNQAISSAYILLPKIFQNYGKERIYANGYAALMELEHFNFQHNFEVSWKRNEPKNFQPGVYDDIYFIDGENYKNLTISDISTRDIFKMIADSIFQDFSNSDFANYKRGVRINLLQYKQRFYPENLISSDETFSCKYSSFGQASISIPVDRIILSCSYKLCEDIINYYLSYAEGSQPEIDNYLLNDLLPELGVLESTTRHQLLDFLYTSGGKSSLQAQVHTFLNTLKNDLVTGKRGKHWVEYLLSEKNKFDTNFIDDNDPQRLGMFYSVIYENRTKLLSEVVGDRDRSLPGTLERKINQLINDSSRGVFYTINLLKRLQFILTSSNFDYIPRLEKEIKELQNLVPKFETEIRRKIQELKEDEARSNLNPLKRAAMEGSLEKVITALDEYYTALIKLKARIYAKEICQRIFYLIEQTRKADDGKVYISGLLPDLNRLTGNLGVLKENFRNKYFYFMEKPDNSFNLLIYKTEDIESEYYPRYVGTGKNASDTIKELADKFLKRLGASDINTIVNLLKTNDALEIEIKMVNFAKEFFQNIRNDYEILDILFTKDILKTESRIRGILNQAYPWIKVYEEPGKFKLPESAKKFYIGVQTNSESFGKFKDTIVSIVGSNVEFKDSADKASIIFYFEWAGFPLFYLYPVSNEMRVYYQMLSATGSYDLHIDKNYYQFSEVVPFTSSEKQRLEDAFRAFVLGVILDIFEIKLMKNELTGEELPVYFYTRKEGITGARVDQLGVEQKLLKTLFNEQEQSSLRNELLEKTGNLLKTLLRNGYYAELLVICEYYSEKVYPVEEIESSGGEKTKRISLKHNYLKKLIKEIEHNIPANQKDTVISRAKYLRNNLDEISFLSVDTPKRILKINKLTTDTITSEKNSYIDINKLSELKIALDKGLITEEDYNIAKQKFLNKFKNGK